MSNLTERPVCTARHGLKCKNIGLSSAHTSASTVFSSRHIGLIIARILTSETPSPLTTRFLAAWLYAEIFGATFPCTSMYVHWNVLPAAGVSIAQEFNSQPRQPHFDRYAMRNTHAHRPRCRAPGCLHNPFPATAFTLIVSLVCHRIPKYKILMQFMDRH